MLELLQNIFIGYWMVSITLFLFPIRRKNKLAQNSYLIKHFERKSIMHISHRGGSRENLENTMQAFSHAVNTKTDCLEMDVCFSKDKKIVVNHDSSLVRMCGINKEISDFNYSELPSFQERIRLDFAPNDYFNTSICKTRYMPLMEDVFKNFQNVLYNIEIKTPNPEINKAMSDLILKYNMNEKVIWGARYAKDSDSLYETNPTIPRFFCLDRILLTYLYYVTGLLPFIYLKEDSIQMPLYSYEIYIWKLSFAQSPIQKLSVWSFFTFVWLMNTISKPLIWHLSKRGILVIYWVLNSEQDYEKARKLGAHGIMTDLPTLLKQYLDKSKFLKK